MTADNTKRRNVIAALLGGSAFAAVAGVGLVADPAGWEQKFDRHAPKAPLVVPTESPPPGKSFYEEATRWQNDIMSKAGNFQDKFSHTSSEDKPQVFNDWVASLRKEKAAIIAAGLSTADVTFKDYDPSLKESDAEQIHANYIQMTTMTSNTIADVTNKKEAEFIAFVDPQPSTAGPAPSRRRIMGLGKGK